MMVEEVLLFKLTVKILSTVLMMRMLLITGVKPAPPTTLAFMAVSGWNANEDDRDDPPIYTSSGSDVTGLPREPDSRSEQKNERENARVRLSSNEQNEFENLLSNTHCYMQRRCRNKHGYSCCIMQ